MERIRVSYGYTKNMGNYESERADVSIERDINPNTPEEKKEAIIYTYQQCKQIVHEQLGLNPMPETNYDTSAPVRRKPRF